MTATTTTARSRLQATCPQPPDGPVPVRAGPLDQATAGEIVAVVSRLPMVAEAPQKHAGPRLRAVQAVLAWLQEQPGDGWQERWLAAGADQGTQWLEEILARDLRRARGKRTEMTCAVSLLIVARVVLPDYGYFTAFRSKDLFTWVRQQRRPDVFARLEQAAAELGLQAPQARDALNAITRIVLRTGRDADQITAEDIREQRGWLYRERTDTRAGVSAAWDLLAHAGILPDQPSPHGGRERLGQVPVEAMVGRWQIRSHPVRDALVRYLSERAPSLDYGTLKTLASILAGRFWADIEQHHPGLDTLRLPPGAAEEWKQRLRSYTAPDGSVRPRKDYLPIIGQVRAFYLDIQEWALEDPWWAAHAAPSPVRRSELAGMAKARKKTVAEMHQRVRERLPHLQRLADSAADHRAAQARLLALAAPVPVGAGFSHEGVAYRRAVRKTYLRQPTRSTSRIVIENTETGEITDVTRTEDDAFWSWAVIETLRHTVRVEELLEITQLAIISYRLPATGETVPLLQVVPSKSNEERLLVSPELASVLAAVVKRQRDDNEGAVRLIDRYDPHEKVTGPPLPHLFQRRIGHRSSVISTNQVTRLINDALARAGITAAGQPLRCTAHDFRRMFATEAVTGGLPVHIAAKILGHRNIATTESYLAVFQDQMITAYRAYLGNRRALRPEAEYREPTAGEWREFEKLRETKARARHLRPPLRNPLPARARPLL